MSEIPKDIGLEREVLATILDNSGTGPCQELREYLRGGARTFFLSSPLIEQAASRDSRWCRTMHVAKLHFIVDSIVRQRLGVARISSKRARYVNLHSKVLERFCTWRDAKDAKRFLQERGIIESDGEYVPDSKATGYRLTEAAWSAGILPVPIPDNRIKKYSDIHRDLKKVANEKVEAEGVPLTYLQSHLDQLDLDEEWALRHLEELHREAIVSGRWQDAEAFHARVLSISSVIQKDWRFSRCRAGRLHYGITNLAKVVRRKLRYHGEPLVEADVSGCQPLIAATLYDEDRASQIERESYLESILAGRFYEDLGFLAGYQGEREKMKRDVLKWVFFGGKTRTDTAGIVLDHPLWTAFRDRFPILSRKLIFSKSQIVHPNPYKGDSALAIRLQGTESAIFIGRILNRLAREYPNVPAFPVHDCMMTTATHSNLVEEVIREEFHGEIGVRPRVTCAAA